MIPHTRMPEITEFMLGITVRSYSGSSSSMDVFIPALMLDKSASATQNIISVNDSIFVSREAIRTSGQVTDQNYVNIKVSRSFNRTFEGSSFPTGSQVRIFVPDLCLDNALIVPFI